ncbi:hypothetical protein CAOG_008990 [Capsaspora owczarzaki ATCC 30864]|uniref:Uncharacterized protein n=1 Tax=Capsaspora owczarzaki (strain ATCC 30864) TaxID=595528 RepID=A0A0D2UMA6_CAPO3|nr:hypothetical protein CAOG_008990 [Capsaspora owczarzaki ATCC 30864]
MASGFKRTATEAGFQGPASQRVHRVSVGLAEGVKVVFVFRGNGLTALRFVFLLLNRFSGNVIALVVIGLVCLSAEVAFIACAFDSELLSGLVACLGISVDLTSISNLPNKPAQRAALRGILKDLEADAQVTATQRQKKDAAAALKELELEVSPGQRKFVIGDQLLQTLKTELDLKVSLDQAQLRAAAARLRAAALRGPLSSEPPSITDPDEAIDTLTAAVDEGQFDVERQDKLVWPRVFQARPFATMQMFRSIAQSVFGSPTDRKNFPVLLMRTSSGCGKTAFAKHAISQVANLMRAQCNLTFGPADTPLTSNQSFELTRLLERSLQIFIDFNGGDCLYEAPASCQKSLLAARLAAHGLCHTNLTNASCTSVFSACRSGLRTPQVLDAVVARHRQQHPHLARVLIFVHIDEDRRIAQDMSRSAGTLQEATDLLQRAYQEIVAYNVNQKEQQAVVVLLLTGTALSGLKFDTTQHEFHPINLLPFDLRTSMLVLRELGLHESWCSDLKFRRLVRDLGENTDLAINPSQCPMTALEASQYMVNAAAHHVAGGIETLVELSFANLPVSEKTLIGPITVEQLAHRGVLITTYPSMDRVQARMPVAMLEGIARRDSRYNYSHGRTKVMADFHTITGGDGDAAFEIFVLFSVACRLNLLRSPPVCESTLQSAPEPAQSALLYQVLGLSSPSLQGSAPRSLLLMRFDLQNPVAGVAQRFTLLKEQHPFITNQHDVDDRQTVHTIPSFSSDAPLEVDMLGAGPCHPVFQCAGSTTRVNGRVALRRSQAGAKPVLLLFQMMDVSLPSASDLAEGVTRTLADLDSSPLAADFHFILVLAISGNASQAWAHAARNGNDRVVVLVGHDSVCLCPMF